MEGEVTFPGIIIVSILVVLIGGVLGALTGYVTARFAGHRKLGLTFALSGGNLGWLGALIGLWVGAAFGGAKGAVNGAACGALVACVVNFLFIAVLSDKK